MNSTQWIERAVRYVPVKSERNALRQELWDHYSDRLEALQSTGMGLKEAEQKALAAMGDPDETGRLLRKVHGAWLTWALRITRVLLVLLLLASLGFFGTIRNAISEHLEDRRLPDPTYLHSAFVSMLNENASATAVRYGTAEGTGHFGSHPIRVTDAWTRLLRYEPNDTDIAPKGTVYYEKGCLIFLQVHVPFWIDPDLQTIEDHTVVTTSQGKVLSCGCDKVCQGLTSCTFYINVYNTKRNEDLHLRCDAGEIFFDFQVHFGEQEDLDGWLTQPAPADEAAFLEKAFAAVRTGYRYNENYKFETLSEERYAAEALRAGALELSVPRADRRYIERSPRSSRSDEDPFCFSEVDFAVELKGPWQQLFLTEEELWPRLRLTDNNGNESYYLSIGYQKDAMMFADRGYYLFSAEMPAGEEPAAWYELIVELDDGPVKLRLTPAEGS